MNKQAFLDALRGLAGTLSEEERARLVSYYAEMIDDRNRVRVVQNEKIVLRRRGYRYFGVVSLGETEYSAGGCFYEARRAVLRRTAPSFGISNEITGEYAEIEVFGDPAFVIESV